MSVFLRPAIYVVNNLSFSRKFLILFVLFLIPLLSALTIVFGNISDSVSHAESAVEGKRLISALQPIAITMAKHRGNSSQHLNGGSNKVNAIKGLEADLVRQFEAYRSLVGALTALPADGLMLGSIESRWQPLLLARAPTNAGQNFSMHSAVITSVLQHIHLAASRSGLVLADDLPTYYLTNIMAFSGPRLQENLGQLRGKAAGGLADGEMSIEEQVEVTSLLAGVTQAAADVTKSLQYLFDAQEGARSLMVDLTGFQKSMQKFVSMLEVDVIGEEVTVSGNQVFTLGTQVIGLLGQVTQSSSALLDAAVASHLDDYRARRNMIMVVSSVALALIVYLLLGIIVSIRTTVNQVKNMVGQLAEGDFTSKLELDTRDELGDIAVSLNQMVTVVGGLIGRAQSVGHSLSSASAKLQEVSGISSGEVEKQRQQTELLATAATQMAATSREVAQNCSESSVATQGAYEAVQEGVPIINRAIKSIDQLSEDVAASSAAISLLEQDVGNIDGVIGVIRSIADQTNLLALNAAIEAARAGEQGRGFAVVADEVRTLASRTQESTAKTQAMIEELQAASEKAVAATESGRENMVNAVNEISRAGEAFKQIDAEVGRLSDLNAQISTASEEQSAVAEEISENTNLVNESASMILTQMQAAESSCDSLFRQAEELDCVVKTFSV